jgi:conjugative transfer signal peptidase TraF
MLDCDGIDGTRPRRHRFRWLGLTLFVAGVGILAGAGSCYSLGIRLNLSGSIPLGLYRIVDEPIFRGTVVLVCLPPHISEFARNRRYVPSGSCPDGSSPLGKTVAAIPGDTVSVDREGVTVNHSLVGNSQPLLVDNEGRQLQQFPTGTYLVSRNEVWLVSSFSPRSFDSRYFGPVSASWVVSRVRALLTLR